MLHSFIYWFICWSNRMTALLLCYHFTALCTSRGDISVSAICYIWMFFQFIITWVASHSRLLLLRQPFIQPSFLSTLFATACFQPTPRRQLTTGMSIYSLCPSIFLQVSSDRRCWGQEPPVPKLSNQSILYYFPLLAGLRVTLPGTYQANNETSVYSVFISFSVTPSNVLKLNANMSIVNITMRHIHKLP